MMNNPAGPSSLKKAAILSVLVAAAGALGYWLGMHRSVPLTTPYSTVLLTNGAVYFGRLEGLGSPFPILHDVFYLQNSMDDKNKVVSNTLIKRGKEWHQPDRMILNSNMIVLVEPVNPASRVADLIAEANKK
jgi:hypothetical protein